MWRAPAQARLAGTQTVADLLKLTETLQAEKERLQNRQQREGMDQQRLQQALSELRAVQSRLKVGTAFILQILAMSFRAHFAVFVKSVCLHDGRVK